jgi:hypothetical protein
LGVSRKRGENGKEQAVSGHIEHDRGKLRYRVTALRERNEVGAQSPKAIREAVDKLLNSHEVVRTKN